MKIHTHPLQQLLPLLRRYFYFTAVGVVHSLHWCFARRVFPGLQLLFRVGSRLTSSFCFSPVPARSSSCTANRRCHWDAWSSGSPPTAWSNHCTDGGSCLVGERPREREREREREHQVCDFLLTRAISADAGHAIHRPLQAVRRTDGHLECLLEHIVRVSSTRVPEIVWVHTTVLLVCGIPDQFSGQFGVSPSVAAVDSVSPAEPAFADTKYYKQPPSCTPQYRRDGILIISAGQGG